MYFANQPRQALTAVTEIPVIVENNIDLNSQLTSNLVEGVGSMCGIRSGKLLVVFNAL